MTITNEPLIAGQPVKFIVRGFPEEESIKAAIERFYRLKPDTSCDFFVYNSFSEQIMSGSVDGQGKIGIFTHSPRTGKSFFNNAADKD